MCCTGTYMTVTTLNVPSQHVRNTLCIFIINVSLYAKLTGSCFTPLTLSWRIHLHEIERLKLLTSTLFVDIIPIPKDRGVLDVLIRIPSIYMQDPIEKIPNKIPWIVPHLRFPAIYIYCLYQIVTVPQIASYDNLINFNLLMQQQILLIID